MAATLIQLLVTLTIILKSCGQFVGAASLNFSTPTLDISEGAPLNMALFINKTGSNTMGPISFTVTVMQGTATPTSDYIPNGDYVYTFNSGTMSLPVQTQLVADRAGEGIENFRICLPEQSVLEPMGAKAVYPSCVNITIIDDDSVVIGFRDDSTSVDITEGASQTICAELKPFGLELDPFDSVPLDLTADSGNGVSLGTLLFTFTASNTVQCATVSVADNNFVDGTRISEVMLVEQSPPTTTVPTELYPRSAILTIADDDVIKFRFEAQPSYTLLEGETISDIRIRKYGNATTLTFEVSPVVEAVDPTSSSSLEDDITISKAQFTPPDTEGNVDIEIPDDNTPEGRQEFSVSLSKSYIRPVDGYGAYVIAEGEDIRIIVYDNDFSVGFIEDSIKLNATNPRISACVRIFTPLRDIHQDTSIPLSVTIENSTSIPSGSQVFERSDAILNRTNLQTCFNANFSSIVNKCGVNTTIKVFWVCDQNSGTSRSNYCQNTTTLTTYKCTPSGLSGSQTAGIAIGMIIVIVGATVSAIIIIVVIYKKQKEDKNRDLDVVFTSIDEGSEGQRKGNDSGYSVMIEDSITHESTTTALPAEPISDFTQQQSADHSVQMNDYQQSPRSETPADKLDTEAGEKSLQEATEEQSEATEEQSEYKQYVSDDKASEDFVDPNGGTLDESSKQDTEKLTLEHSTNII